MHQYLFKGIITENEKEEIILVLNKIVNHKELSSYFNQNNVIYNEQEILTSGKRILIPDRLVFNKNKVTIIDYKTGISNNKYHQQINNYGIALEELTFKVEKKLLVYINEEITIEEV